MSTLRNLALFGLIATGFAFPANAQLADDTFSAAYFLPTDTNVYGSATFSPSAFSVGAGTETIGDVEGVTDLVFDFSANSIFLTFMTMLSSPTWATASFNGPIFTSAAAHGAINPVIGAGTTFAGFDASRVLIDDNRIGLNFSGLSYVDGTVLQINFSDAGTAVPEPATWLMMIVGFGAVGAAIRRSRMSGRLRASY